MIYEESLVRPRIPRYVIDTSIEEEFEWREEEIMFISLITNISLLSDKGWETTYYMNAQDAAKVLRRLPEFDKTWVRLRKVFDIGVLNKYTISITPHRTDLHLGQPIVYRYNDDKYIIKDVKNLMTWYYLVGRLSGGDVLSEPDTPVHGFKLAWTESYEAERLSGILRHQIKWPKTEA